MAQNLPTFFIDNTLKRTGEVDLADWDGGMNRAASCAPLVGANTGDYDPKESDWARIKIPQGYSQHIGVDSGVNDKVTLYRSEVDDNDQLGFSQATADTPPGGTFDGLKNETGKTIPAGSWAWGTIPI